MAETVIVRQCQYGDVRVLYGNILRVEGDLLVTTANNRLAGREGLDEKIQQKAGPEHESSVMELQWKGARKICNHAELEKR